MGVSHASCRSSRVAEGLQCAVASRRALAPALNSPATSAMGRWAHDLNLSGQRGSAENSGGSVGERKSGEIEPSDPLTNKFIIFQILGGEGVLSSVRQYCFTKALDIRSANSSSCSQVFHREPDSSRHKVTGSAGACTRVRCPRTPRCPSLLTAGALCTAESAFADWMKSELQLGSHTRTLPDAPLVGAPRFVNSGADATFARPSTQFHR